MEVARHRRFRIHHCLGRGGYGEVYLATMVSPGGVRAEVAVKLLRVDLSATDDAVRRLRDEGRMLGQLQHPTILRVLDLAILEGRVGLVTEYVDGEDLLGTYDDISARALLECVAAVAEGLDAAWNHVPSGTTQPLRLVHRDIKPSNIRIGRHGEVKILDFGIARSVTETADREARTGTGSTVGSLAYMAPERFTRAPVSPASDVHGLGCVLYEGLTGHRLFVDPVPVEMFRLAAEIPAYEAHLDVSLADVPATVPAGVTALLRRMLAHAPADRPTAGEVRHAAEELAETAEGPPLKRWARDRRWPDPKPVGGFLDGRTITEGTQSDTQPLVLLPIDPTERSSDTFRIDVPGHPQPSTEVQSPTGLLPFAVRQEVRARPRFALAAALVALLAVAGVAWAAWPRPTDPVPPEVVEVPAPVRPIPAEPPPAPPPPVPVPVVAPVPPPVPPVAVLRTVPGPKPRVPTPIPELTAPAPTPVPPPTPAPEPVVDRGRVAVLGEATAVELRRGSRRIGVPGDVEAGAKYELWADFGFGTHQLPVYVDVLPGQTTTVNCNKLRATCALQ